MRKIGYKERTYVIPKQMYRVCNNPGCNDWNDEPEHIAVPYKILEEKEQSYVCMRAGWHQKNVLAKSGFFDTEEECEAEIRNMVKEAHGI